MTTQILIAGFGGQGVLFLGKLLAYAGLIEEKEVSWLPSYGPEMRGGTANCSVIIGDEKIGSPIVDKPDILIAMNAPSFEKYKDSVKAGGQIYIDSSLISAKCDRTDVEAYYIPSTALCSEKGYKGLSNIILFGSLVKHGNIMLDETVEKAMKKVIPAKKADMLGVNLEAFKTGYDFAE